MCGLKAAKIHERPFRAAKDHVQTLAALDFYLPKGKKDSDVSPFIIPELGFAFIIIKFEANILELNILLRFS